MEKKNVKCPACGVVLEVKNTQGEEVKNIKCLQCGKSLRVWFQKQKDEEPLDAPTYIAGKNNSETQIASGKTTDGKAFILCEGKCYELHEGCNIVGRKASTSKADVQLEVADHYMSRQNVEMRVYKTGGTVTVTIACYKNLNPVFLGKEELKKGNELVLSDGDEFTMGKTQMTIKIE